MRSLENRKVALVTGSSLGIGATIARLFADYGAAVAIHGWDRAAMGPHGIRVTCIVPETILTERNKERILAAQQQT